MENKINVDTLYSLLKGEYPDFQAWVTHSESSKVLNVAKELNENIPYITAVYKSADNKWIVTINQNYRKEGMPSSLRDHRDLPKEVQESIDKIYDDLKEKQESKLEKPRVDADLENLLSNLSESL